jgi:hypothetical protein
MSAWEPRRAYGQKEEASGFKKRDPVKKAWPTRKDELPKKAVCFGCGQEGHIAKDPKCPKNKAGKGTVAQMYAAREITQEDGDKPGEDQEEETAPEDGDVDEDEELDEGEPYEGSQYSSEGEELDWEEFQYRQAHGDDGPQVRMCALTTGRNATDRYVVLDEIDDIEAWDFNEVDSSSSENEEFPLLVEVSDDESVIESDGADVIVYEPRVRFAASRAEEEMPLPKEEMVDEGTSAKIRKSSKKLERPARSTRETRTFLAMMEVNGQAAVTLFDSGCTTDAISPEMVRVVGLKVHELEEQVPVQLGTKGSQSRINYGTKACVKYGPVNTCHYFDIINIDRYDVVVGTVFMRKHAIVLDFGLDQIRYKDEVLPMLKEGTDEYLQVRRQAMRRRRVSREERGPSKDGPH